MTTDGRSDDGLRDPQARPIDPADLDRADDPPHVAEDLAAGQGVSTDEEAIPAEDVMALASIRPPARQDGVVGDDEVDRLGEMTDTRIYEGDLEARPPDSDQPDEPDEENIERLEATELRADETDDPNEAAEEGMTWVPPTDPPVVVGSHGEPQVAAGFGMTADEEPFDADHHSEPVSAEDEMTERVVEALRAHAGTADLVDRLAIETAGSRVVIAGTVDDLTDEDEITAVAAEVDGVTSVDSRIEVVGLD